MILSRLVKQIVLPTFFLCAVGTAYFVFATKECVAIEPLIPQNIVANLLQTYSDQEKSLIQDLGMGGARAIFVFFVAFLFATVAASVVALLITLDAKSIAPVSG